MTVAPLGAMVLEFFLNQTESLKQVGVGALEQLYGEALSGMKWLLGAWFFYTCAKVAYVASRGNVYRCHSLFSIPKRHYQLIQYTWKTSLKLSPGGPTLVPVDIECRFRGGPQLAVNNISEMTDWLEYYLRGLSLKLFNSDKPVEHYSIPDLDANDYQSEEDYYSVEVKHDYILHRIQVWAFDPHLQEFIANNEKLLELRQNKVLVRGEGRRKYLSSGSEELVDPSNPVTFKFQGRHFAYTLTSHNLEFVYLTLNPVAVTDVLLVLMNQLLPHFPSSRALGWWYKITFGPLTVVSVNLAPFHVRHRGSILANPDHDNVESSQEQDVRPEHHGHTFSIPLHSTRRFVLKSRLEVFEGLVAFFVDVAALVSWAKDRALSRIEAR